VSLAERVAVKEPSAAVARVTVAALLGISSIGVPVAVAQMRRVPSSKRTAARRLSPEKVAATGFEEVLRRSCLRAASSAAALSYAALAVVMAGLAAALVLALTLLVICFLPRAPAPSASLASDLLVCS
jgi:hypothetical protein